MKKLELIILLIAIVAGVAWTIIESREGYKQSNAMIVARSIDIFSTIDGEVENEQLDVGTAININDIIVKIRDIRIDHGRITELKTKIDYLTSEIKNTKYQKKQFNSILNNLNKQLTSYKEWLQQDLRLKSETKKREIMVAKSQKSLKTQDLSHSRALKDKKIISLAELQTAKTKAIIADNQLKTTEAELARIHFLLKSLVKGQIFFENGNTSYWQENINSIQLKIIDNNKKIAELQAQLKQFSDQEKVEQKRLKTDFVEVHRSPFSGIVNAVYVTKGTYIKSGTLLMQLLDCSKPVVFVPIPESKYSEFSVGKTVIVNPIDSEQILTGTIKYISSGPLINLDKTIALQQDMIEKGNYAVIEFDDTSFKAHMEGSCETARRAVVTIPMNSFFDGFLPNVIL